MTKTYLLTTRSRESVCQRKEEEGGGECLKIFLLDPVNPEGIQTLIMRVY